MQDVPPAGSSCKPVPLSSTMVVPRERAAQAPPCDRCACPSWWNGWRLVFPVVARIADRVVERQERWVARAKCSSRSCGHGFTVRPPDLYPQRQFQLDVAAAAVADVALGGTTATAAATTVGASERSVRRWTRWVARLADQAAIVAAAVRLDADAPAGTGLPVHDPAHPTRSGAAQVLVALEQLAAAVRRRGVQLAVRTGLAFVLAWQRLAHGVVVGLVAGTRRLSPRMAGFNGGADE